MPIKDEDDLMKILIDNGHGIDTCGKRSPDGLFREYKYTREIAAAVVNELRRKGNDAERVVPETNDISLSERVRRVNAWCNKVGSKNVLFVSIHVNAAGNGSDWMNARGWSAYTSKGQTGSDVLATRMYDMAEKLFVGHRIRTECSDGDPDIESNFYVLKNTKCVAVLTENFFMDNKDDVAYLNSDDGRDAIVKCHVDGIINFIKSVGE